MRSILFFVFVVVCFIAAVSSVKNLVSEAQQFVDLSLNHRGGVPNKAVWSSTTSDNFGITHIRFKQYYRDTTWEIYGGESIVHKKANSTWVTDGFKDVTNTITAPTSGALNLLQLLTIIGASFLNGGFPSDINTRLVVMPKITAPGTGDLTYLVSFTANGAKVVWSVKLNGEKKLLWNGKKHAAAVANGTVLTETYGYKNVTTNRSGTNTYNLEDATRFVTVVDCQDDCADQYFKFPTDSDNIWNTTSPSNLLLKPAYQAFWSMQTVYDYFKLVHGTAPVFGTRSIPLSGSTTLLYPTRFNSDVYGDPASGTAWSADGIEIGSDAPFRTSLDIFAHELTHGIMTLAYPDLSYSYETGAVEEGWCDVFAALVEYWKLGETANMWLFGEAYSAYDTVRHIDRPNLDSRPVHMSQYVNTDDDSGGIHINSGIISRAFYLLSKGGIGINSTFATLPGIGLDKAAAIFYRAMTVYFTTGIQITDAKSACLYAVTDLYGSNTPEYRAVVDAWGYVGVNDVTVSTELISNGQFESSDSPWVTNAVDSKTNCIMLHNSASEAHGGKGYALLGASSNTSNSQCNIAQSVTMPNTTSSATITYWIRIKTQDNSTIIRDSLEINAGSTSGGITTSYFSQGYSNCNYAQYATWTQQTFSLTSAAVTSAKGKTFSFLLKFSTVDSVMATFFYVDDISFKVTQFQK